jgi:putative ABC transport system permease protein
VCALGIALFSGFNLYVSTIGNELERAYRRQRLADYWVYKPDITEGERGRVEALGEIARAERRKTVDLPLEGRESAALRIHGLEGNSTLNLPELVAGSLLTGSELDALLLDSRFAEANGLAVGDTLGLGVGEQAKKWRVQGIVRAVEYVYFAPNGLTVPEYHKYGFAYTRAEALPQGYNELVLALGKPASQAEITAKIREALGSASVISRAYQASAGKIADDLAGNRRIGTLFPLVFFLTAALITWTAVSRMLEQQRQHLGTLRCLGFSKKELIARYTLYGLWITLPSMALGWIVSRFVIARTLYGIATVYYTLDAKGVDWFSVHFFLGALGVAVVTCGAACLTCRKALAATPAALLRPKPPAAGHRIFLERLTPFWKRLSFSGKLVVRNLFRSKARMGMGLVGAIGSAALVLCGFGMMVSMDRVIEKSFSEILRYDAEVKLKTPLTPGEAAGLAGAVEGVEGFDTALSLGVTVYDRKGTALSPYLVALPDAQRALRFVDPAGRPVPLPAQGVLITPRMADALGVAVGGGIDAEGMDGARFALTVAGIVDFPVGSEIYMSAAAFRQISALPFSVRVLFLRGQNMDLAALSRDPRVALVETKAEMRANLNVVLEILQGMQGILIAFSGLLSVAVMMVLGRINFDERVRELATLKVLGFHKHEMKRLVLRENVWLTLLGIPAGIAAAQVLLGLILSLATTPDLEIQPQTSLLGLAAGCALVLGFTLFVNFLLGRKFKGIDMVASLKSVE